MMRFGLSTTICGRARLEASDLETFARHAFDVIELSASPGHFDLRDAAQIAQVRQLVASSGIELGSVAAPLSDASLGLAGATELGVSRLVVVADGCRIHPTTVASGSDAGALRRILEPLALRASERGVTVTVEFPRGFSPDAIVNLLESLDSPPVGVCLDVGHAHLAGGAPEAIETLSGYVLTTHLHDNQGREDSHRPPYSGSVDWPGTLMALWKTGFAGPGIVEIGPDPDVPTALSRAVGARTRLQAILDDLAQPMVFPE